MNNESAVFAGLSTLLRTNVITPICTYLQTRQQQGPVTVDELANVLKLPAASPAPSPSPATSFAPMPSGFPGLGAPPALTGFAGMPMPLSAQKKKSSKSASSQPAADHERCIYQITRGVNKGNRCPAKVEAGLQYCTQHKGTRAAQARMQGGTPQTGQMMPGMQSMPGLPGIPGLPGLPGMPGSAPTQPQQPRIQVHLVAPGLYREAVHGLAIKTGNTPNEYIACGVLADPKSTNITPLTPDKIEYCRQINLAYVDPSRPDAAVIKPTSPSANVSGQTLPPMAQQMPALPSTLPGMPQAQGLGGLPPGFPSVGFGAGTAVTDTHNADDPNDDDDDDDLDEDDA